MVSARLESSLLLTPLVDTERVFFNSEKVADRIQINLQGAVEQALDPIPHVDKGWTREELVKRIVRYIKKACTNPQLMQMRWDEVAKQVTHHAMQGYSAACGDEPWFYDVDLTPALCSAAWEIVACRGHPQVDFAQLQEKVVIEFDGILNRSLLTKAIWEATTMTFSDASVQAKFNQALTRAYQPALDECMCEARPLPDSERVENFMRLWIEDVLRRVWTAVHDADHILTEEIITRLFYNVLEPFGSDNPFSCVPVDLTANIGSPPHDWPFIRTVVKDLWRRETLLEYSNKKRKVSDSSINVDERTVVPKTEYAEPEQSSSSAPVADKTLKQEISEQCQAGNQHDRHPACTSAEDCIGTRYDGLLRHLLDGEPGDVYCQSCWESFLEQNPDLEGIPEENPDVLVKKAG